MYSPQHGKLGNRQPAFGPVGGNGVFGENCGEGEEYQVCDLAIAGVLACTINCRIFAKLMNVVSGEADAKVKSKAAG